MKHIQTPDILRGKPKSPLTIATVFHWLTKPSEKLSVTDSRRSSLLAWLLLALQILILVALVVTLTVNLPHTTRRFDYAILIFSLYILIIAAYVLNHRGYYLLAAMMTVVCAIIGPWVSILMDPSILQGDFVPLTFVTISVLLSSILLPSSITIILSILQMTGLILLSTFNPATATINWPSFLIFVLITSILSILFNLISRRDLKQIDLQTLQLKESESLLRELSIRDPLTGLFNRRYLDETLDRELKRAARKQLPLGMIMLDIDHFKLFNDTYGHAAGDLLLKQLGDTLKGHIRAGDIACRYGGEEFLLILPEATREVTRQRAEQLREKIKHIQVLYENQVLDGVTMSLGVAVFPLNGKSGEDVMKAADDALYQAKREGRDRVVVAGGASRSHSPRVTSDVNKTHHP